MSVPVAIGVSPFIRSCDSHWFRCEARTRVPGRVRSKHRQAPAGCAEPFLRAECEHLPQLNRVDVPRIIEGGVGRSRELAIADERMPSRMPGHPSKIETMCGWCSAAAIRVSRTVRSCASATSTTGRSGAPAPAPPHGRAARHSAAEHRPGSRTAQHPPVDLSGGSLTAHREHPQARIADSTITRTDRRVGVVGSPPRRTRECRRCPPRPATSSAACTAAPPGVLGHAPPAIVTTAFQIPTPRRPPHPPTRCTASLRSTSSSGLSWPERSTCGSPSTRGPTGKPSSRAARRPAGWLLV
jgi:hypothetical protein